MAECPATCALSMTANQLQPLEYRAQPAESHAGTAHLPAHAADTSPIEF